MSAPKCHYCNGTGFIKHIQDLGDREFTEQWNCPACNHPVVKSLQSQNDRLVRALEKVDASWQRHGPRIIESRGGLGDNRVCEVNESIEEAQTLLTEIKKGQG